MLSGSADRRRPVDDDVRTARRSGARRARACSAEAEACGLGTIEREVGALLTFAAAHPELEFLVTEIGCGIAGHTPGQIAPLFRAAPANVLLPQRFAAVLAGESA